MEIVRPFIAVASWIVALTLHGCEDVASGVDLLGLQEQTSTTFTASAITNGTSTTTGNGESTRFLTSSTTTQENILTTETAIVMGSTTGITAAIATIVSTTSRTSTTIHGSTSVSGTSTSDWPTTFTAVVLVPTTTVVTTSAASPSMTAIVTTSTLTTTSESTTPSRMSSATATITTTSGNTAMCWNSLQSIVEQEGGAVVTMQYQSVSDCESACESNIACKSFTACPDYGMQCYLKDKQITPGEPEQAPRGGCKTYYQAECESTTTRTTTTTQAPSTTLAPSTTSPEAVPPCVGPTATNVCDVPVGSCATLSGEQSCAEVLVRGTLTIDSGSKLHTPMLHVHQGGTLIVGTWQNPVENVELDLQQNGELRSEGSTYIYGQPKTSWTLLTAECDNCITISVIACSGWKVGDKVVLVGTGNGKNGQTQANGEYRTDERTIQSILQTGVNGCQITLDQAAGQRHRSEMYKDRVPINSEVLNMDRSIHIYGSNISTRQQYTGFMKMHHARVSNCGKLIEGEYCLHFHHVGLCPKCSFVGNAVGWPSHNKGITVHGTSKTVVEGNVVYGHMGAYMYIEDGNEIGNLIKNNALVCPTVASCKLKNGVDKHRSSDDLEQAGLYAVSVSNDFIGNHIAGMENAFFQDFQSGGKVWGADVSLNKICPTANPFGIVSDNYFHNNAGFGFYSPHSSFPTRVTTDANGLVTDWNSCLGFDPNTGADNSASYTVENHVELFHNFGAGGYDGGETSFKNAIFAFGLATNYYKTFRRGIRSGPICDGCFYTDNLFPNTPGGACMWEYKDTIFEDTLIGLHVNHHCGNDGEWTGGLCASHIWFTGTSEWKGNFKVSNDGFPKCEQYSDSIVHYSGTTYMGTTFSHPAFRTDTCQTSQAGGDWTACSGNDIRIVRIYSADRGQLTVINNDEGYTRVVPYTPWVKSASWHRPNSYDVTTKYQNGGMGYTFLVKAGQSYTLQVADGSEPDFFTLEYSDPQMPADSISLTVEGATLIAGSACTIQSTHPRNWITPYGPYIPASGAWWDCRQWAVTYTQAQHQAAQTQYFQSRGVQV